VRPPRVPQGLVELQCRRGDGTAFPADVNFGHLKTINGGLFVIVVQDNTDRHRMLADMEDSRQALRDYAVKIERAREDERKSIAREVHDEFGQVLTGLRMELSLVRMQFGKRFAELDAKIESMTGLTDRAINEVRSIATHLRPTAMDMGLVPSIEWLRDEFVRKTQVPCTLTVREDDLVLDETRTIVVYRILQESLTNITKYARAQQVEILLACKQGEVTLLISDNGCGFDTESPALKGRYGLLGMRERALSLGGTLRISSEVGGGTQVFLSIPVEPVNAGGTT
jgi:signal transduction histidine kinase